MKPCRIAVIQPQLSLLAFLVLSATVHLHAADTYTSSQAITVGGLAPSGYLKHTLTSADWNAEEKVQIEQEVQARFPDASMVDYASKAWNCHGYAFGKGVWLTNPAPEWTYAAPTNASFYSVCGTSSGSFSASCKDAIAEMGGGTVVWGTSSNPIHSGEIVSWDGTAGGVYGVSKWGNSPFVSHQFKAGKYPPEYGNNLTVYRLWFVDPPEEH